MALPVPFVVRGGTRDRSSLELTMDGAVREQYLNWLSRVTSRRTAA
jgi:hypothetical protein